MGRFVDALALSDAVIDDIFQEISKNSDQNLSNLR